MAFLIVVVVMLVGALMFLLGRTTAEDENLQAIKNVQPSISVAPQSSNKPRMATNPSTDIFSRPVRIGGEDMFDACSGNSIVVGLNPKGDNFLAVKAGPHLKAKRIDKLGPNTEVYLCETSSDGAWSGIVYDGNGKWTARCGVMSPVPTRRPYTGPCQSGWVSSKYLELIAG